MIANIRLDLDESGIAHNIYVQNQRLDVEPINFGDGLEYAKLALNSLISGEPYEIKRD